MALNSITDDDYDPFYDEDSTFDPDEDDDFFPSEGAYGDYDEWRDDMLRSREDWFRGAR